MAKKQKKSEMRDDLAVAQYMGDVPEEKPSGGKKKQGKKQRTR